MAGKRLGGVFPQDDCLASTLSTGTGMSEDSVVPDHRLMRKPINRLDTRHHVDVRGPRESGASVGPSPTDSTSGVQCASARDPVWDRSQLVEYGDGAPTVTEGRPFSALMAVLFRPRRPSCFLEGWVRSGAADVRRSGVRRR